MNPLKKKLVGVHFGLHLGHMDVSTLKLGYRYLFYYTSGESFRGNFIGSLTSKNGITTLVFDHYAENAGEEDLAIHYIDSAILAKFETLNDILRQVKNIAIPEDVLLEIDQFW